MAGDDSSPEITELLSAHRIQPYLVHTGSDHRKALELYEWATRMAAAAFEMVAHLEVILRNSVDFTLTKHYNDEVCGIPWFLRRPPMNDDTTAAIDVVRERLRPQNRDTRPQIIAGLSFWVGMFGSRYEELWRHALRHAFPNSTGARKQIATEVEAVRKFRNRIAHHDSILKTDILFEVRRIIKLAGMISTDAARWLESVDRSGEVDRQRPQVLDDTVVVPARDAWPFYQAHHAYVCQPGRWFQPVERIAFYSDREIKPDVPLIIHRRDSVVWTEQHATVLAQSDDRGDRKIAAIIRASRPAGWDGGLQQVFILTQPGDPRHRMLARGIPHEPSGRGSAFVQRQRYVSLHTLETAATTSDLIASG